MDVQAHRLLAVQISTRPVSLILSHPFLFHSSQPLSATRPRFFGGFAQIDWLKFVVVKNSLRMHVDLMLADFAD
jgi:hypothetical protein